MCLCLHSAARPACESFIERCLSLTLPRRRCSQNLPRQSMPDDTAWEQKRAIPLPAFRSEPPGSVPRVLRGDGFGQCEQLCPAKCAPPENKRGSPLMNSLHDPGGWRREGVGNCELYLGKQRAAVFTRANSTALPANLSKRYCAASSKLCRTGQRTDTDAHARPGNRRSPPLD